MRPFKSKVLAIFVIAMPIFAHAGTDINESNLAEAFNYLKSRFVRIGTVTNEGLHEIHADFEKLKIATGPSDIFLVYEEASKETKFVSGTALIGLGLGVVKLVGPVPRSGWLRAPRNGAIIADAGRDSFFKPEIRYRNGVQEIVKKNIASTRSFVFLDHGTYKWVKDEEFYRQMRKERSFKMGRGVGWGLIASGAVILVDAFATKDGQTSRVVHFVSELLNQVYSSFDVKQVATGTLTDYYEKDLKGFADFLELDSQNALSMMNMSRSLTFKVVNLANSMRDAELALNAAEFSPRYQ